MKKRRLLWMSARLLIVLLGFGAFTQVTALSYGDLVGKLRAGGASVVEGGAIRPDRSGPESSTPLLSGADSLLTVNAERVEVYEYVSTRLAEADASHISPDGSTFSAGFGPLGGAAAIVEWIAPPHFYKSGRLIVQYIGTHADVTAALTQVMGRQFAGGNPFSRA